MEVVILVSRVKGFWCWKRWYADLHIRTPPNSRDTRYSEFSSENDWMKYVREMREQYEEFYHINYVS